MLDYIPNDGYTEEGFIEASPGYHGDFRFSFRPMLVEERARIVAANNAVRPEEYERLCAAELAKKITVWSLRDKAQQAVPITAANILRLKPRLNSRIFGIVTGLEASDVDPQWTDAAKTEAVETKYESALSGQPAGDLREERDEKN
jgi:hypothetical protein